MAKRTSKIIYYCYIFHLRAFPKNINVGVKFTNLYLSYTNFFFSEEKFVRLIQNKILILNFSGSILYLHKGRNTHWQMFRGFVGILCRALSITSVSYLRACKQSYCSINFVNNLNQSPSLQ